MITLENLNYFNRVRDCACFVAGILPEHISASCNKSEIVLARTLFCGVVYKNKVRTFSEIGAYLGKKHSTVVSARKRFATDINKDFIYKKMQFLSMLDEVKVEKNLSQPKDSQLDSLIRLKAENIALRAKVVELQETIKNLQ